MDREIVVASRAAHLQATTVVPTAWWVEAGRAPDYTAVCRRDGHVRGMHGVAATGEPVVDLRSCHAVLPFSAQLWLFRQRDGPLTVVLPDGTVVKHTVLQRYAQRTPQWTVWAERPADTQPWCAAPTLQALRATLKNA